MPLLHHKKRTFAIHSSSPHTARMFGFSRVYLDRAAGMSPNPSSPHEEGRRARSVLERARTTIARLLEVKADDIVFTSGATQANALAILGSVRAMRDAGVTEPHVLYLPSSHASIVENVKLLAEEGVAVGPLPLANGAVDIETLKKLIRPTTVLVAMDAVCGETGIVWNTRQVREALDVRPSGAKRVLLHVDASQAPLTEKLNRAHYGADMLVLDASKVGVIRGIGCLIAHRTISLTPLYRGGGQERGLVPGTEAPELAEAFASALVDAANNRESFRARAERLREEMTQTLTKTLPAIHIHTGRSQAPHILTISLPGRDTDYLVALLDKEGFAVSTRSACETDSEEGSRAVFALTNSAELAKSTLRISWGPSTSARDISRFAAALIRAVAFIDSRVDG